MLPLDSLPARDFGFQEARHLLSRAGFGGTPRQIRALERMGPGEAVDFLLNFESKALQTETIPNFNPNIMRPLSTEERRRLNQARQSGDEKIVELFRQERQKRQRSDRTQIREIRRWWMREMIETPHPLKEKLTLFWHGHFATGYRKIENSWHMYLQNQLFRKNAAGNFKEGLTRNIIRDPAMIQYLDNHQNRRGAPNENLARELMELFTLGEGNGYTEYDIKEGARALTGYTFNDDSFQFRQNTHDNDSKKLFGKKGDFNGDDLVNIIFQQSDASKWIIFRLIRFFVRHSGDLPDAETKSIINRLSSDFRKQNYQLKPILRKLFRSKWFYEPKNRMSIIKSPVQLAVQAVRTLYPPERIGMVDTLVQACNTMGQSIFEPPSVAGWDGGRSWINTSTLYTRQNLPLYLLTGALPDNNPWELDDTIYDEAAALDDLVPSESDDETCLRAILAFHLDSSFVRESHLEPLRQYLQKTGSIQRKGSLTGILSLVTAMPEYQLC